jgi:hypothetical protein
VAKYGSEPGEHCLVDLSASVNAVAGTGFEGVEIPAGLRNADQRDVERVLLCECVQRREGLLIREVAVAP